MAGHAGVTNRIEFDEAADLLTTARACVAFVIDGAPHVEPAEVRAGDGPERFLVGIHDRAGRAAQALAAADADETDEADEPAHAARSREVVLVIDDGVLFFDLRAIYVRGSVRQVPPPVDEPAEPGRVWFEIEPTRVTCWDYGRLRAAEQAP